MRRLPSLSPLLWLPAALFLTLFPPAVLDVGNAGWLIRGTDNGENALGLHAWLHDQGAGPFLRTHLLGAPEGVPLLFTDSNPLLGTLARPFAALLPVDAQLVGPWLLLCIVLQFAFARLLLRRHAPGPAALWLGAALLAVLPTFLNRIVHANLFAHWLILAALWLFTEPPRRGRAAWWIALVAVTTLVHSYLLVMVGVVWASAVLMRVAAGDRRIRRAAVIEVCAVIALVVALAAWLGVGGDFLPTHNYGAFAMPLDALWNPANSDYSTLLPAIGQREGRGFEGFQYLGAGMIGVIAAAIVVAARLPPAGRERDLHRRLRWLVPALAALTLLAISNYPDIAGHRLPRVPLPEALTPALDLVRASGRLFWPVAYTLALAAIVAVYRLGRERAALVLGTCVAVQGIDLSRMVATIRAGHAAAEAHRLFVRTPDRRWEAAIVRSEDVAFMPGDATRDLALFQEIAWRAASHGRPVRTVYAARTSRTAARRLAQEERAFAAGRMADKRLYVLLPGQPVPVAGAGRLALLDGVRVILPVGDGPSSPRSAP